MSVTIAILAGGESRRMGRDKAQIVIGGETLLERTARLALEVSSSVLVVGRTRPADWPFAEVAFRPDEVGGQGPLGGLETALAHAEGHHVLLLACDLPRLTAGALRWLIRAVDEHAPTAHGIVTVNAGQPEPLFAVYAPACLPLAEHRLAENRRSLRGLIEAGDFAVIDAPPFVAEALHDADTPADLAELDQSPLRRP